ncbi:helix-turn-helix domain-containing protein [Aquabacterium sp. A08]|uniref:helix-turn-helix domain-containing protein n=1 Tax=Aquabacterium sp. A08 TaxID=2718532 RepID=UPI00141DE4E3|nr:helix-turn-helix transcriptional regulator [Aquabacterium sp. A08]NIC41478.1 helix-turn-helix transcriptional regulator [Aquabacterium sp. A08]NIC42735.1 helix-turn-helix transcriptional regulator [Aquabacterium sp. A08]
MHIGQVIRVLRTERGATLESLAFEAGTDASNLSRIERGVQQPTEDGLKAIAGALGTSVAAMYALAEGKQLTGDEVAGLLRPEDMGREAIQMRRYFRSLTPEYQKLALELVKTLARTQPKI